MLRKSAILIAVAVISVLGIALAEGHSETRTIQAGTAKPQCKTTRNSIRIHRQQTWRYQDRLNISRTRAASKTWAMPCRYARWVNKLWKQRHEKLHQRYFNGPIVKRLNRGLAGTPMSGLGVTLRDIGARFNVSPYFMAAVAGTESSFGAAGCSNNPKNVWGLANCDGRWYVPYFNSWEEAITFYADFLSDTWPSATSPYHYYGYAACDECWGRKTAYWMERQFGVEAYTKFPY